MGADDRKPPSEPTRPPVGESSKVKPSGRNRGRTRAPTSIAVEGGDDSASPETVRATFTLGQGKRTQSVHLRGYPTQGASISSREVVRIYLQGLLVREGYSKSALAAALSTSRGHLLTLLRDGGLLVDHVDSLARARMTTTAAIWRELANTATRLEAVAYGAPDDADSPLQGRRDRAALLSGRVLGPDAEAPDAGDAHTPQDRPPAVVPLRRPPRRR